MVRSSPRHEAVWEAQLQVTTSIEARAHKMFREGRGTTSEGTPSGAGPPPTEDPLNQKPGTNMSGLGETLQARQDPVQL